jgi:hypothetical protein
MGDAIEEGIEVIIAFFVGGFEGFLAPIFELVFVILLFTMQTAQQSIQVAFNNTPAYAGNLPFLSTGVIFSIFAAINFFENFIIGLKGPVSWNSGYCLGAIFGVFYFWNAFTTGIFQEAIWDTIVAVVIIGVGIAIRLYAMSRSER